MPAHRRRGRIGAFVRTPPGCICAPRRGVQLTAPTLGERVSAARQPGNRGGGALTAAGVLAALLAAALMAAACVPVTRPVIKIGLVAPFEGRYRDVGYEVIYAVRLAVREAHAAGGVAGYAVELTALADGGDPASAAEQARKLGTPPQNRGALADRVTR